MTGRKTLQDHIDTRAQRREKAILVGEVTKVYEKESDDLEEGNIEVNVTTSIQDHEFREVPVLLSDQAGHASVPQEGDMVLINWLMGKGRKPVVTAVAQDIEQRSPDALAGHWRYEFTGDDEDSENLYLEAQPASGGGGSPNSISISTKNSGLAETIDEFTIDNSVDRTELFVLMRGDISLTTEQVLECVAEDGITATSKETVDVTAESDITVDGDQNITIDAENFLQLKSGIDNPVSADLDLADGNYVAETYKIPHDATYSPELENLFALEDGSLSLETYAELDHLTTECDDHEQPYRSTRLDWSDGDVILRTDTNHRSDSYDPAEDDCDDVTSLGNIEVNDNMRLELVDGGYKLLTGLSSGYETEDDATCVMTVDNDGWITIETQGGSTFQFGEDPSLEPGDDNYGTSVDVDSGGDISFNVEGNISLEASPDEDTGEGGAINVDAEDIQVMTSEGPQSVAVQNHTHDHTDTLGDGTTSTRTTDSPNEDGTDTQIG